MFLSLDEVERYQGTEPYLLIGLISPTAPPPNYPSDLFRVAQLLFRCHDVHGIDQYDELTQEVFRKQGVVPFTAAMADLAAKFLQKNKHQVDLIIAHCEAGISRSCGFIDALQVFYDGTVIQNPGMRRGFPNIHIKQLMLNALDAHKRWKER